jgi:hypothetical protein
MTDTTNENETAEQSLSFGEAMQYVKLGKNVRRKGCGVHCFVTLNKQADAIEEVKFKPGNSVAEAVPFSPNPRDLDCMWECDETRLEVLRTPWITTAPKRLQAGDWFIFNGNVYEFEKIERQRVVCLLIEVYAKSHPDHKFGGVRPKHAIGVSDLGFDRDEPKFSGDVLASLVVR